MASIDDDDIDWDLARALDDDLNSDGGTADEPAPTVPSMDRKLSPCGTTSATASDPLPAVLAFRKRGVSLSYRASSPHQAGRLESLPKEIMFRVLAFLSAHDLSLLAHSCCTFRVACSEDALWRRLFCARWGQGSDKAYSQTWKEHYFEQDAEDLAETRRRMPDGLEEMYLQMQLAKRQQVLSRAVVDDMMVTPESIESQRIVAWQKSHGWDGGSKPRPDLAQPLRFHQIGDFFCCEENGWIHHCDAFCKERIVDKASDMLVCPISGYVTNRYMTEWEVDGRCEDDFPEEFNEETGGRLANAYLAGYYCEDERELRRVCGVQLR